MLLSVDKGPTYCNFLGHWKENDTFQKKILRHSVCNFPINFWEAKYFLYIHAICAIEMFQVGLCGHLAKKRAEANILLPHETVALHKFIKIYQIFIKVYVDHLNQCFLKCRFPSSTWTYEMRISLGNSWKLAFLVSITINYILWSLRSSNAMLLVRCLCYVPSPLIAALPFPWN